MTKLALPDRASVTILSNECGREAWRNRKALLPLPSLIGKQDYDEKDISTLCSEAPQQARLPQAHVYGQRPQRFERTSPQGTQEVVRELGAPPQRHRALKIRIQQPCAAKGNPTGFPFFHAPQTRSNRSRTLHHAPDQGVLRTSPRRVPVSSPGIPVPSLSRACD